MNGYNPFSLIKGTLNNQDVYLRPVQFDDSDYDKEFKKSNGDLIRPTMATTTCPKCSCVIEQIIPQDFNLINGTLKVNCLRCVPVVVNTFPFEDPIDSMKLSIIQVNPSAITDVRLNKKCTKETEKQQKEEISLLDKLFKPEKPMGLGEFIKSKAAWNKLKQKLETSFVDTKQDIFDIFASIPEEIPPAKDTL